MNKVKVTRWFLKNTNTGQIGRYESIHGLPKSKNSEPFYYYIRSVARDAAKLMGRNKKGKNLYIPVKGTLTFEW